MRPWHLLVCVLKVLRGWQELVVSPEIMLLSTKNLLYSAAVGELTILYIILAPSGMLAQLK